MNWYVKLAGKELITYIRIWIQRSIRNALKVFKTASMKGIKNLITTYFFFRRGNIAASISEYFSQSLENGMAEGTRCLSWFSLWNFIYTETIHWMLTWKRPWGVTESIFPHLVKATIRSWWDSTQYIFKYSQRKRYSIINFMPYRNSHPLCGTNFFSGC